MSKQNVAVARFPFPLTLSLSSPLLLLLSLSSPSPCLSAPTLLFLCISTHHCIISIPPTLLWSERHAHRPIQMNAEARLQRETPAFKEHPATHKISIEWMCYPQCLSVICLVCPMHVWRTESKLTFMTGGKEGAKEAKQVEKDALTENQAMISHGGVRADRKDERETDTDTDTHTRKSGLGETPSGQQGLISFAMIWLRTAELISSCIPRHALTNRGGTHPNTPSHNKPSFLPVLSSSPGVRKAGQAQLQSHWQIAKRVVDRQQHTEGDHSRTAL